MERPINRELVLSRIGDIEGQLESLRAQAALPDRAFLDDPREVKSARYSLIVLVEASAAICGHISARWLKRPVDAYPECFQVLAASGLLAGDLVQDGANAASPATDHAHRERTWIQPMVQTSTGRRRKSWSNLEVHSRVFSVVGSSA